MNQEDQKEIEKRYAVGTPERAAIEYSSSKNPADDVPAILVTGFKLLMGVTLLIALNTLFSIFSS